MFLPYASDAISPRRPFVTGTLLFAMTGIMLAATLAGQSAGSVSPLALDKLLMQFGFVPAHPNPITFLSYAFLHESWPHLLLNLCYLWVFGASVESAVGSGKFLGLFALGAIVGATLQWLVTVTLVPSIAAQPVVGASAACATMMGIFAVRFYRARLSFIGLPVRPHVVAVVGTFLTIEIGSGLLSLVRGSASGGVAHWAHIGGFVCGLAVAQALRLSEAGQRAYLSQDASKAMDKSVPGVAIKRYQTLLEKEPENAMAQSELARAWLLLGDREQAYQHFQQAIHSHLEQNHRSEAALLYAELRDAGHRDSNIVTPKQLFALGIALEEMEQHILAAETLRAVTVKNSDAPEAEMAMLKVITLYVHHLNRREEAKILLRLFLDRYPHSPWRRLADDLQSKAEE